MAFLQTLLPLLLALILTDTGELKLQQDLQKDLTRLQQSNSHFISDNSILNPSVQTVANDMQLFSLIAYLELAKATYTQQIQGPHQVQQWRFEEGDIRSITQIESHIQLDTVVTQRYLNERAPTQRRITNNFTFHSYIVSTAAEPAKLYYVSETEQGLLSYKLGEKQVQLTYTSPKEGLSDLLPLYHQQVEKLRQDLLQQ
ncbi:hypothetical protein [Pontibacter rugosus]|uniref:Uncharacterized protein n=1 Tax=Pontibacter rugosus TaxID=1745966 RepID=A0ABW3SQU6_9BACT